ncbi:MAG: hypothetical protein JSR66_15140 [Proteobacteria bacterium]|nr:hypothetical protein [Pseudomonadota bacterium]
MFRRPLPGRPALLALGVSIALQLCCPIVQATPSAKIAPHRSTALGGFVKDRALARILGETLFRDTVAVVSDPAYRPAASTDSTRDNSAVAQVARTVLAQRKLDKYLWLIQQAFDDTMWKGGDRTRIEQHFPLIWRTSIMLYEASLDAGPHRVRVCSPADNGDGFDCRDEIARARIVPIPARAPLIPSHQPTIG